MTRRLLPLFRRTVFFGYAFVGIYVFFQSSALRYTYSVLKIMEPTVTVMPITISEGSIRISHFKE